MARDEFADFLRSRRGRLQPADVGLAGHGRRRVPGLRREELAALAGVSVDYYVRLEQGRDVRPSDDVLDALARALKLSPTEREHLYTLARACAPASSPARHEEQVRATVVRVLDALHPAPAFVMGRRMDVLAWNAMAAALLYDFGTLPPRERNLVRLNLLAEDAVARHPDWETVARDTVSYLRRAVGRHPGDPVLAELVAEMTARSEAFRRLWARHDVGVKTHGSKRIQHPLVGALSLDFETLALSGCPDQALVVYTAEPGSPSQRALDLLAVHSAPLGLNGALAAAATPEQRPPKSSG